MTDDVILDVRGVTKRYGGLTAVDDVSFKVNRNSAIGLIGPNGAGKSTLFNVISLIDRATSGSVEFNGAPINGLRPDQAARMGIARTFQTVRPFSGLTVAENLMIGGFTPSWLFRRGEYETVLDRAKVVAARIGLREDFNKLVDKMPYGVLKRLGVGRALMLNPTLLLMDEPFAGVGGSEATQMLELIKETRQTGMTVVIVEHKLRMLMRVIDTVVVLHFGRVIASGDPKQVADDPVVQTAYLGKRGGQFLATA